MDEFVLYRVRKDSSLRRPIVVSPAVLLGRFDVNLGYARPVIGLAESVLEFVIDDDPVT